jgi:hypothetical protein
MRSSIIHQEGVAEMVGHVSRIEKIGRAYRSLVGKSEGKKSLGRSTRRWEDNSKMDSELLSF